MLDSRMELLRRRELCGFLQFARSRIQPADVGIASIGRRRVPGLRRDEVAALCGVSVAWYTWFETGRRNVNASARLIAAVANALRLDVAESTYLFSLAIVEMPKVRSPLADRIESTLREGAAELSASPNADVEAILRDCDRLPVGIYCTTPGGALRYSNVALDRLLGYESRTAHMAKTASQAYQQPTERSNWQRDIEAAGRLQRVVTHARCADGSNATVLDSGSAVRSEDDTVLYYIGFWESS